MQNLDETTDFKYFIKLALNKNISWNVLSLHFDESTTTLKKSKELNNVLIEEMKKLQTRIEELLAQGKPNNEEISNYQIWDRIEDEECESMSEGSDDRESEIIELNFLNSAQIEHQDEKVEFSEDLGYNLNKSENIGGHQNEQEKIFHDAGNLEDTLKGNGLKTHNEIEKRKSEDVDTESSMKSTESKSSCKEKPYPCLICSSKFDQLSNYRFHMNSNHPDEVIKCKLCSKWFLKPRSFREHMSKCHPNQKIDKVTEAQIQKINQRRFECMTCGITTSRRYHLKIHEKTHSGEKLFQCDICSMKFTYSKSLKYHVTKNHLSMENKDLVKCDFCDKSFKTSGAMKKHKIQEHISKKSFRCDQCDNEYTNLSSLKEHVISFHRKEKPHTCGTCNERFSRRSSLNKHNRIKHDDVKPYGCITCEKKFSFKHYLSRHERTHSDHKPFECKICGNKFKYEKYLRQHNMIHTGEKPFECEICNDKFRKSHELGNHKLNHGDPMNKCSYCAKSFAKKIVLKEHMKSHTEVKNFKCTECNRSFLRNWMLNRHLKSHSITC